MYLVRPRKQQTTARFRTAGKPLLRAMASGTCHITGNASRPALSTGPGDVVRYIVGLALLVLLSAAAPAMAAREGNPSLRIPLAPLGYQPMLPEFLANGSSMMTINFAGKDRLLVTFGVRRLLQRDAADPPDDYDHLIGAYYLELPSGKVLARTEWRVHDRGQYLWDLGGGRFLLRVRDTLSLLEPGAADGMEDALKGKPFLHLDRRIVAINVSAEHDLLTVESADRDQVVLGDNGHTASTSRTPVQINFFRLLTSNGKLVAGAAGAVRSSVPLAIPLNASGYLDAVEARHDQWLFRYNTSAPKAQDLAGFDTSCAPHPVFVSRAEFIAFGCRGSTERQSVAGFTLGGDFMWQQNFFESYVTPSFDFAPEAGRFAFGRTLVSSGVTTGADISAGEISGQEIRVYQTYNGKVLLRLICVPAIRAGQNFSLSPDGLRLAVLRETDIQHKATKDYDAYTSREAAVEIYDLPALNKEDRAAVDEARKLGLPTAQSNFELASRHAEAPGAPSPASDSQPATLPTPPDATPANAASDAALQTAADSSGASAEGDLQPTEPRKPPTLYAPDEKPQSGRSDH